MRVCTMKLSGFGHPGTYPKKPGGFFLGKPTLKTRRNKPGPKQSNFDVKFHSSKEIFY